MQEGPLELGSWVIPYKTWPCGHYQRFSSYLISPLSFPLQSQAAALWSMPRWRREAAQQLQQDACHFARFFSVFRSLLRFFFPVRHLWDYVPPFPIIEHGWSIPYDIKFLRSIIFAFFVDELQTAKIWWYLQLNIIRGIARHSSAGSRALFRYFSKVSEVEKLPDPQGALAKDIPSSTISSANRSAACPSIKGRSTDARLLPVSSHTNVPPLRRNREQTADNRSRHVANNGTRAILHSHRVKIAQVVHVSTPNLYV